MMATPHAVISRLESELGNPVTLIQMVEAEAVRLLRLTAEPRNELDAQARAADDNWSWVYGCTRDAHESLAWMEGRRLTPIQLGRITRALCKAVNR